MTGRERRRTKSTVALTLLLLLGAGLAGCDESPTAPSTRALVTFQVGAEQFRVQLLYSLRGFVMKAATKNPKLL